MAKHLLAAGYAVTVFARTSAKAEGLVAASGRRCKPPTWSSPITMVGNPGDVLEVVLDLAACVLPGLRPGCVLLDCTNSSPARQAATPSTRRFPAAPRPSPGSPRTSPTRHRPEQEDCQPDRGGRPGESVAFASAAELDAPLFLDAISKVEDGQ